MAETGEKVPVEELPVPKPYTRADWVRDLRSGRFEQATGYLMYGGGYCCLGVACEGAGVALDEAEELETTGIPAEPEKLLRLSEAGREFLAAKNDNGATFAEIADLIEAAGDGPIIAESARLLSDLEAAKAEETYSPAELRHGTHGSIKLHTHEADELETAGTDLANAMLSVGAALSKAYGCGETLTKEIATQRLETVLDVEVSEGELSNARFRIVGAAARLQLAMVG